MLISRITEPQDDNDLLIDADLLGMYTANDMSRKHVEFKVGKEISGRVYQTWLGTAICLFKANSHLRNLRKVIELKEVDFKASLRDGNTDVQHYYWDVSVESEGVLTQLKAALDSFAVVIGLVTRQSFRGWSKARPTGIKEEFSGQNIINVLKRNLSDDDKKNYEQLVNWVEESKVRITEIVAMRDKFTHPHQFILDFTSGFYHNVKTGEILEPGIRVNDSWYEQSAYASEAFKYIFKTISVAAYYLLAGTAGGMILQKTETGYQWFMNPDNFEHSETT